MAVGRRRRDRGAFDFLDVRAFEDLAAFPDNKRSNAIRYFRGWNFAWFSKRTPGRSNSGDGLTNCGIEAELGGEVGFLVKSASCGFRVLAALSGLRAKRYAGTHSN